ncbi:hypothetical protein ACIQVO_07340 [Streptomyces sp. NPDC101062]
MPSITTVAGAARVPLSVAADVAGASTEARVVRATIIEDNPAAGRD